MGLIDLDFIGPSFTWNYGSSVDTRRSIRLDEACATLGGDGCSPLHDHTSVPLTLRPLSTHVQLEEGGKSRMGDRPFMFQAARMLHGDFENLAERE